MITRRHFLRSSSLLALAPTIPLFIARSAKAASAEKDSRVLVVIQLDGGNDALNTVIPFTNPNRSHFESMAVWHTARMDEEDFNGYGWLGRALDPSAGSSYMIGGAVPTA